MATIKYHDSASNTWKRAKSGAITNGTETVDVERFLAVEAEQKESNQQKVTLTHGLNLIESDTPSPLKVEFYGVTRTNLLGSGYSEEKVFVADATNSRIENYHFDFDDNYYLFAMDVRSPDSDLVYLLIRDADNNAIFSRSSQINNTYQTIYAVISNPDAGIVGFGEGFVNGVIYYKNERLYKITSETYNKIGVLPEYTGDALADKFPYVDSYQPVRNVFAKVSGSNLLPNANAWSNLHADVKVLSDYEMELVSTSGGAKTSQHNFKVTPNTTFTFKAEVSSGTGIVIRNTDESTTYFAPSVYTSGTDVTFTTNANAKEIYVRFWNYNNGAGTFNIKNWMLNLGSTAKPFSVKNDSYLYAEVVLAGNDNKKDILRKNYSLDVPRWEKEKWFEQLTLDGSLEWTFESSYSEGFTRVSTPLSDYSGYGELVKYDGKVMEESSTASGADLFDITSGKIWITISGADATGYDLTQASEIQRYFSDKNYFLCYQRSTPVIEPVQVEGDLSITGDAIVEVGELVKVRVDANPSIGSTGTIHINRKDLNYTPLDFKVKKIIAIYADGEDVTDNFDIRNDEYGNGERAFAYEGDYNPNARFTITAIVENEGQSAHLNEVKATFQNSIKSSFSRVVEKQSDIATDQSIMKKQLLDLIVWKNSQ